MKKILPFLLIFFFGSISAQEILANVQINYSQIEGSNIQVYKTLEKSLRDFINNTSWTGKKLQNYEKIKCNFSIIITERNGNSFKSSIVVQSVRPVYNSEYESPMLNINDTNFPFEYTENENLIFNERQYSGKNLTDVISFYVYLILGYDGDSFQNSGGQAWFDKSLKISQNSQNQRFGGWSQMEGTRTRGLLIDHLLKQENKPLRNFYYNYHRNGLDMLSKPSQAQGQKNIYNAIMQLKVFENNFQMNYPFNVMLEAKKDEIFKIFQDNKNPAINMNDLKQLVSKFSPKDDDTKWNKWK